MNALNEAARIVNTAWCKGDMRKEAEAAEAGDTYCAAGAMVHAFSKARNLNIDWADDLIGSPEDLDKYADAAAIWKDEYDKWARLDNRELTAFPKHPNQRDYNIIEFGDFIGETLEGQLLAKVILENYSDRIGYNPDYDIEGEEVDVIISFNDHSDTTREEVIAMMEKAAVSFDEKIALEEKTTDDLVEEINELVNA